MPLTQGVTDVDESDHDERRARFGKALGEALAARGLKQSDLAEMLGTTQSTVSAWINARSEPAATTVFHAEEVLDMAPGFLSRLLDYLPVSAVGARPDIEESINFADELGPDSKRMLVMAYRTLREKDKAVLRVASGTAKRRTRTTVKAVPAPPPARPARRSARRSQT